MYKGKEAHKLSHIYTHTHTKHIFSPQLEFDDATLPTAAKLVVFAATHAVSAAALLAAAAILFAFSRFVRLSWMMRAEALRALGSIEIRLRCA